VSTSFTDTNRQTYLAREYDPPGLSNEATADERIQRRVLPQEIESAKDKKRCDLLSAFGSIACAGAGCLQAELDTRHDWTKMTCTVCDREGPARRSSEVMWNHTNGVDDWKDATAALLAITGLEEFRRSKKQRILMAQAIRRVFNHLSDPDYLSLEHCSLGQWLMSSSNSTLRELRVASM
jgi:serine/threonine-protein kinase ATR